MRRLRLGVGYVLLVLGAVVLLPGLYLSIGGWASSEPQLAADVVACEPTVSAESCVGSICQGQSRSEWAFELYEWRKAKRRLVIMAGLLFVGSGVVLLGVSGLLFRSGGAARAGSESPHWKQGEVTAPRPPATTG